MESDTREKVTFHPSPPKINPKVVAGVLRPVVGLIRSGIVGRYPTDEHRRIDSPLD
jgi:hypothetical protein